MRGQEGQLRLKILRLQRELEKERNKNLEMTKVLLDRLVELQDGYNGTLTTTPDITLLPLEVLKNRKFGPLQAIVIFLKEQHKLSYREIGKLTGRSARTISTTYYNAKRKGKRKGNHKSINQ